MDHELTDAILQGNLYDIKELVQKNLEAGASPQESLEAMLAGLDICGDRFERGEYFLPELMMAGETFQSGIEILEPKMRGTPRTYEGTVVLGTVSGDIHDIGKNLVGFMLESAGFRVIDLGVNISKEGFIKAVREHEPDCLGLSALLTTTMLEMEAVIRALEDEGIRENVKVILGGAPVSRRFAESIDADGYASDAASGVRRIRELVAG